MAEGRAASEGNIQIFCGPRSLSLMNPSYLQKENVFKGQIFMSVSRDELGLRPHRECLARGSAARSSEACMGVGSPRRRDAAVNGDADTLWTTTARALHLT